MFSEERMHSHQASAKQTYVIRLAAYGADFKIKTDEKNKKSFRKEIMRYTWMFLKTLCI